MATLRFSGSPPTPPPLAERMLSITIRDGEWRDSILGDLAEEFAAVADGLPSPAARRWYWRHALSIAGHRMLRAVTRHRSSPLSALPQT